MTKLKSFDRVAHVYDATRGLPDEVERQIADGIAAILHEVSATPRLAEIGIGTGRIAVPLAGRGVHVTGIDLSRKMLAVLRAKRADIDVLIAEAAQPPFRERVFDASLFVHILHLVPDPEATIRATMRLVRPGGVMIEAGDDHEQSRRSQAVELVRKAVEELCGIDIGSWTPFTRGTQLFESILAERGATVVAVPLARWTGSTTARRLLERIERRDYSSAWEIPEAMMPALLERVSPQIEELFGGPDTVTEYNRSVSMRYARLPAGSAARARSHDGYGGSHFEKSHPRWPVIISRELLREEIEEVWKIDRSEVIDNIYRLEGGRLVLTPEHHDVSGWPPGEAEKYTPILLDCFDRGGWFHGVFDHAQLFGAVVLESKRIGTRKDHLQLQFLHVSNAYRNRGWGTQLFERARATARQRGARRLYISATPSENTVNFYLRLGCAVAPDPDPELVELEPEDIHLACDV